MRGFAVASLVAGVIVAGAILVLLGALAPHSEAGRCPPAVSCETITVAVDGGEDQSPQRIRYAMRSATADRMGTLLVLSGGPGVSGVAQADNLTSNMPAAVLDHFDLVMVDHRGVGGSSEIRCDEATIALAGRQFLMPEGAPAETWEHLGAEYQRDCFDEAGLHLDRANDFSTEDIAADLEAVREHLGLSGWHILGQSYGTILAQHYAELHPQRTYSLVLDAPLDARLTPPQMAAHRGPTVEHVMAAVFTACAANPGCAHDFAGGPPAVAYADLVDRLRDAPALVTINGPQGVQAERRLTADDLGRVAYASLADAGRRSGFLRLLAAAARGDLEPLARSASLASGLDPTTGEIWDDPGGLVDAAYYAVVCGDWPPIDATKLLATAGSERQVGALNPAARAAVLRDALCLGWENHTTATPSAPDLPAQEIPTLIISATQDPIAPPAMVDELLAALPHASRVRVIDGPHVATGRGDPCVDSALVAFLLRTLMEPADCHQPLLAPYVALPPTHADEYTSALDVVAVAELELLLLPEYQAWSRTAPLNAGCRVSGQVSFTVDDGAIMIELEECAATSSLPLNGTGRVTEDGSAAVFQLTYPGASVAYSRSGNSRTLEGTVDGHPVRLTE